MDDSSATSLTSFLRHGRWMVDTTKVSCDTSAADGPGMVALDFHVSAGLACLESAISSPWQTLGSIQRMQIQFRDRTGWSEPVT